MELAHRNMLALLSDCYARYGQPARAEALLDALVALHPEDEQASLALARARIECDKPESALRMLDGLLERGHLSPALHLLRSRALIALKRDKDAERAMRAFIAARQVASAPRMPAR